MTPEVMLAQYQALIGSTGEEILIRRYSGTGPARTSVDTPTMARVVGYAATALVGSILQGDRRIITLVDTLAGILPVLTSDKVVVRGKELTIKSIDDNTRRIGGTLIALEIQAGG